MKPTRPHRKLRRRTRAIAPRLADGHSRESFWSGLPLEIKEGLRQIALHENQSMSWVIEQVIIDYFDLKRPRYRISRKD